MAGWMAGWMEDGWNILFLSTGRLFQERTGGAAPGSLHSSFNKARIKEASHRWRTGIFRNPSRVGARGKNHFKIFAREEPMKGPNASV